MSWIAVSKEPDKKGVWSILIFLHDVLNWFICILKKVSDSYAFSLLSFYWSMMSCRYNQQGLDLQNLGGSQLPVWSRRLTHGLLKGLRQTLKAPRMLQLKALAAWLVQSHSYQRRKCMRMLPQTFNVECVIGKYPHWSFCWSIIRLRHRMCRFIFVITHDRIEK